MLGDFSVTLLNYVGIYALVALGLVLLTGFGGLTSFGQAAFVGIGAYATAWLTEWCAYDRRFCEAIGLAAGEKIAGFVHIGRPNMVSEDRPRPALADVVSRLEP